MNVAIILQVLAAFGGLAGISALVNVFFNRKKTAAEASNLVQDANTKIIQNLSAENQRLQQQMDDYERDMQRLRNQIRELSERLAFYDLEMSDLRVLAMGNVNWSRRANDALRAANKELENHGINLQFNLEDPPNAAPLMAKFDYIENRTRDKS